MFVDVWWGGINLTILLPVLFAPLLLSLQLLLCFKVKSLFVRLFPVGLFAAAGGWFLFLGITIPGWDSLGYIPCHCRRVYAVRVCTRLGHMGPLPVAQKTEKARGGVM